MYETILPEVRIGCNGDLTSLLATQDDGSVVCTSEGGASNTTFLMDDINGYFAVSPEAEGYAQLSLSDSIYSVSERIILRPSSRNSLRFSVFNAYIFLCTTISRR